MVSPRSSNSFAMNTSRGSWLTGLSLNTGWFTPGQLGDVEAADGLLLRLVLRVLLDRLAPPAPCRSMPWSVLARVHQAAVLELLDQVGDALVAVAAVRVAGVRQKADQRLVELHALGLLRAVGRHRALGALRRDRAGAVGQQQPDQRLEGEQIVVARRVARAARRRRSRRGSRCPSSLRAVDAAEAAGLVLRRVGRSADQRAEQLQPPREALGRERARCACATAVPRPAWPRSRPAPRLRSGWPGRLLSQRRNTERPPRASTPAISACGARIGRVGGQAGLRRRHRRCAMSKLSLSDAPNSMPSPAAWKRSIMNLQRVARRLLARRARRWPPLRPAPRSAHCRPRGWPAPPPARAGRAG